MFMLLEEGLLELDYEFFGSIFLMLESLNLDVVCLFVLKIIIYWLFSLGDIYCRIVSLWIFFILKKNFFFLVCRYDNVVVM